MTSWVWRTQKLKNKWGGERKKTKPQKVVTKENKRSLLDTYIINSVLSTVEKFHAIIIYQFY